MRAHSIFRTLNLPVASGRTAFSFQDAVIRSTPLGEWRGKSGHRRAGFPSKEGGDRLNAVPRPVPQKTNHLPRGGKGEKVG